MADQKIDGALFKSMVIEGALAIAENKERANELNVFPVPDGDTGTNMSMTLNAAADELRKAGAQVDVIAAYETVPAAARKDEVLAAMQNGALDCVTFGSSSTV